MENLRLPFLLQKRKQSLNFVMSSNTDLPIILKACLNDLIVGKSGRKLKKENATLKGAKIYG